MGFSALSPRRRVLAAAVGGDDLKAPEEKFADLARGRFGGWAVYAKDGKAKFRGDFVGKSGLAVGGNHEAV